MLPAVLCVLFHAPVVVKGWMLPWRPHVGGLFFNETLLKRSCPFIVLKAWHGPGTLIVKRMCQFVSVVGVADGR